MFPHQLMMSATPIPRTLSMTYYADLDVSVIDEMPPGRKPVATRLFTDERRSDVLKRVREACAEGQQAYWVCPVIEESKDGDVQTAVDTYAPAASGVEGAARRTAARTPVAGGKGARSCKPSSTAARSCSSAPR